MAAAQELIVLPGRANPQETLRGPDARLLGGSRARARNREPSLESRIANVLERMARLQARAAVEQINTSEVVRVVFAKANEQAKLENELRRLLQVTGSRAYNSAVRRASRGQFAEATDARMREFMRTKEVHLQQIMSTVRTDVRNAVREVIASAIEEQPRPSTGTIAQRIRRAFQGAPSGRPAVGGEPAKLIRDKYGNLVPEMLPAPPVRRRVLPTESVRLTDDGQLYVFSSERAALIARTEMAQAEQEGIAHGYELAGVLGLRWLSYNDGRSGDRRHNEMNNRVVRIGQKFILPDRTPIRWPGDHNAPIKHTANCRCATAPVVLESDFRRYADGTVAP